MNGRDASSTGGDVPMNLEVIVIPVSDVDRAKEFYERLGWRLDADVSPSADIRLIQFTPPGSGCSVQFGKDLTLAVPGSGESVYLIVSDLEATRAELVARGVEMGEIFHEGSLGGRFHESGRVAAHPRVIGAAMAPSPPCMTRTATAGCSRRSRAVCPVVSTRPRRPMHRQPIWPPRSDGPRRRTASTRSGSERPTRTGPIGTPTT